MNKLNEIEFIPLPNFDEAIENRPDFHSVATISLGELLYDGVIDWNEEINSWDKLTWNWKRFVLLSTKIDEKTKEEIPDYEKQQELYDRLCNKIEGRYFNREISLLPLGQWKREFIRTMGEIMPKYNKLYGIIDNINILQEKDKYGKRRNINSSFPQTLLNNNSDYASSGKDAEYEEIIDGNILDRIRTYNLEYKDIDVMILDDIEILFSPLLSVSVNGF